MYKQTNRPNKEKYVRAFFSQFSSPIKTYLCFPSLKCRDIVIGMEMGALNKDTKIIAIERDPQVATSIKRFLRSRGFKFEVFNCEAERAFIYDTIDGAYIDVCGQITAGLVCWVHLLNFTDNAKVAFTFCKPPRSIKTYYQHILKQDLPAPRFIGNHCDQEFSKICSILEWALPKIRWNIAKEYKDTRVPMTFIGGYYGKSGYLKMVKNTVKKNVTSSPYQRFVQHLSTLKAPLSPQQRAGITIRLHQLSVGERASAIRRQKDLLKEVGY